MKLVRVKTLKEHGNSHPPVYLKRVGRKYHLPEREANNLASAGTVAIEREDDVQD